MQNYARGQIVLWTRSDSPLKLERIEDLAQPAVGKVAIANPDRAPYGHAAREALTAAGLWETIQPKIVIAENIQQTHQYAETGNVDAAISALSLSVPAAAGDEAGRYVLVPQELYTPLDQALAVIKGTKHEAAARTFAAFVTGPQGREVLQSYGFTIPDGSD
jgi:molybdate transport system substrate-binding protein